MLFSKAIQIKLLVNRFNQHRQASGFSVIRFECEMFSIGHWAIDLELSGQGVFFSSEMERLITLYAGGGFHLFIGANNNLPVLHFQ